MYTKRLLVCTSLLGLAMACGSDTEGSTDDDDIVDSADDDAADDDDTEVEDDDVDPPASGDDDGDDDDDDAPSAPIDAGTKPPAKADTGTAPAKTDAATSSGGNDGGTKPSTGDAGKEPTEPTEPTEPGEGPSAGCLDGITNYKTKGKFTYKAETSGRVKMWVPAVPAGCKVPVIHLSNGTGATCSAYGSSLEHLASHGFLATCYEDTNTGPGTECIMALETAIMKYPELADKKIGSTGHSQGGGAAFVCLARAEEKWGADYIYAGHAIEPASGFGDSPRDWATYYKKIKSPMFMFNGSADALVSSGWVGQAFNAMGDTEKYWYEATGAAHIPVPTRWTSESTVVFFRWKLLGDKAACEYFKKMPDGPDWAPKMVKNAKDC